MAKTVAIVLAAGRGTRMNSDVHKQYLLLRKKPVLYYSLKAFEDSFIDEIILVTGAGEEAYCLQEVVEKYHLSKVTKIISGGKERYHSVYNGLQVAECDYVFIHDGARPFVSREILERAYVCVKKQQACVVGMPVKDTIKLVDEEGFASKTPRRDLLWAVQTPQVFSCSLIKAAYEKLIEKEAELLAENIQITDDAMVVETFGKTPVKMVEGSYENIKITTPEDLEIAGVFADKIILGNTSKSC